MDARIAQGIKVVPNYKNCKFFYLSTLDVVNFEVLSSSGALDAETDYVIECGLIPLPPSSYALLPDI